MFNVRLYSSSVGFGYMRFSCLSYLLRRWNVWKKLFLLIMFYDDIFLNIKILIILNMNINICKYFHLIASRLAWLP
jgi:hypothetical protein